MDIIIRKAGNKKKNRNDPPLKLTNEQGDHKRPYRQLSVPHLNGHDTKHKHAHYNGPTTLISEKKNCHDKLGGFTEHYGIPPLRDLWLHRHQAGVDIGLLAHRAPGLRPDLLAIVQGHMREGRRDRGERETVRHSECGPTQEEGYAVCQILIPSWPARYVRQV
jgi:hypothetical protein